MRTKNKIIAMMMLAFSAISFASCGDNKLEGTYSHDYPAPGSIVIPGTDGFDADGFNVWTGSPYFAEDCKINLADEVENASDKWDYNYYLDVYLWSEIDDGWDVSLTYADGSKFIGRTNNNYKKIEVIGFPYKK